MAHLRVHSRICGHLRAGAGLPGMVLAVMRPHWRLTLLDSLRKRCDFLQRAAEVAGARWGGQGWGGGAPAVCAFAWAEGHRQAFAPG